MGVLNWLRDNFYIKRMNSAPGWIVMALAGIALAYLASEVDAKLPIIIAGGVAGLFFLLFFLRNIYIAYYCCLSLWVINGLPARMVGVGLPMMGILMEMFGYLLLIAVLAEQFRKRESVAGFWKNPISVVLLLIMTLYVLELFNVEMRSKEGWFNFVRKQLSFLIFYYVSYVVLDSYQKIKFFFKVWIGLALIVALYGMKQQYFGFTNAETAWLYSDPMIAQLLFQGGMFRKFSVLPDPAQYGIFCVIGAMLTLVFAIREDRNKKRKRILYVLTTILLVASSYSGTRTCNLMIIGGLASYIIFTLNEPRTIFVLMGSLFVFAFLLLGPFRYNPIIARMNSIFESSKDASSNVRDTNRKLIQPYVRAHPIGGGLNTCGLEGDLYNPGHALAGFPPDSGYMKIMLEQGWVGLALHVLFYFVFLQRGIYGYFSSRNPEIKTMYIALTVALFSLIIGQYSQLAISQYPLILLYFASLAILYKLKQYDKVHSEADENAYPI